MKTLCRALPTTMRVGIVGNGANKFTEDGEALVIDLIRRLLTDADTVVSGGSPLGGVDEWAEQIGSILSLTLDIKRPKQHKWDGEYGYKQRNLDIAKDSDVVHVIVAKDYPPDYKGRKFKACYHCKGQRPFHVKSGGCWTGLQAQRLGKPVKWHLVGDDGYTTID